MFPFFFFCKLVHCCYDFRIKLMECFIENFVHFRFELNVLEYDWLIKLAVKCCFVEVIFISNHNQIYHWCLSSMLCQPIFIFVPCLFYHGQEGEVAMPGYH